MKYKKANTQIGIGIIIMAVLLFLGGIFLDSNNSTNIASSPSNSGVSPSTNTNPFLFYLSSTGIGKQMLETQNYPNIILGSKEKSNVIFRGNDFRLNANMFTTVPYSFEVDLNNATNVNHYLLYFNFDKISGNQDLVILANGKVISKNKLENMNFPIKVYNNFNTSKIFFTFLIEKPSWYSVFNWNKFDIKELNIVEISQDKKNNLRNFDFKINKNFLERVYLNLVISCEMALEVSDPIEVMINGFILSNANPNCLSRNNKVTVDIPINILSNRGNRLTLKTNGYYKVAQSINKIYFNDQQSYIFNIANFNDFSDALMYGDFDSDVIDIRINGFQIALARNEYISILPYLKYGANQISFLNKPVVIKKFAIEKSNYY